MLIAGIIKNSFVDFPGLISAVLFTPGCNMNCWYCHNEGIKADKDLNFDNFLKFLETRKNFLDGVVFSGGEPTLQKDLKSCIKKVKSMGFKIKLDTNGLNPEVVEDLLKENLLDYIAMDIKAPEERYSEITRCEIDLNKIKKSIEIIKNSGIDYEFRTTLSPDLYLDDVEKMSKMIKGAKKYAIQQYRQMCYQTTRIEKPHEPDYIKMAVEIAKQYVTNTISRGV